MGTRPKAASSGSSSEALNHLPSWKVVDVRTPEHVAWRCVEGPDTWIGTNLTFDLKHADGETVLLFTHAEWREPVEFVSHCRTEWAVYLLGLKASREGGKGNRGRQGENQQTEDDPVRRGREPAAGDNVIHLGSRLTNRAVDPRLQEAPDLTSPRFSCAFLAPPLAPRARSRSR